MKGENYMKNYSDDAGIRGAIDINSMYFSPIDILKELLVSEPFKSWRKLKHDLNLYDKVKKRKLMCFDGRTRYTETVDLKDAIRIVMVLNTKRAILLKEYLLDVLTEEVRYILKNSMVETDAFVNISKNVKKDEYNRS